MASDWNIWQNSKSLSVTLIATFIMWLMINMGILTVFTHLAQTFGLRFDQYAFISLLFFLAISAGVFWQAKKRWSEIETKDWLVLLFVFGIALLGAFVSLSMRRVGRFIPDEYYYGANPAYYVQHPVSRMDFKLLFFYSGGQPFYSVGYLTATAFDYILGIFSYLTKIQFIKVYYELGGGLGGFLIPLSIFLVLSQFSRTTTSAALGTFFTTLSIFLLAETVWTPGGYSFIRSFEGKIILLFAGIPLFTYYSLKHFSRASFSTWLELAAVVTMVTGLSTTAFMIFPFLGAILFVSYWVSFKEQFDSVRTLFVKAFLYFSSFFYLIWFALFVAQHDHLETAIAINERSGYTDTIQEYLNGFINPAFPLTPVFVLAFSLAILFFSKGKRRIFLSFWMGIVLLTIPNPVVAKFLLIIFRGIYFRLFYIYPFPLIIGIVIALLYEHSRNWHHNPHVFKIIWTIASLAFVMLTFVSPTSIFTSDRYTWGDWSTYKENAAALEIVSVTPHGLMVAPYPISGAVRMIDSDYDQLITRYAHMDAYLNLQGRGDEAKLRVQAGNFLDNGKQEDYQAFVQLIEMYPQVNSIVFYRKIFYRNEYVKIAEELIDFMKASGFIHRGDLEGSIVFWK